MQFNFGSGPKHEFCLLQVPKCFVLVQTFCTRPKNELHLVLLQKILCRLNNWIYWMELMFWSCTKFGTCTICKSILALTQKIWTIPKSFATCRRIRHRSIFCVLAAPIEGTGLPLEKPVRIRSAIVLILLQLWQIHAYSIWTFISPNIFIFFFNSFFYSIAITFWISSKFSTKE